MNNLVEVKNNYVVTSSRQVAESFGKQHRNVVRAIKELLEGVLKIEHTPQMFFLTSYKNEQNGQIYPEYYMNRDGFSLLVMGFTGQKALEWKIKYIEAFNWMEEELKKKPQEISGHLRVNIPGNAEMQKKIANVEDSLKAMQRLMVVYNRYNYEESRESIQVAMSLILAYMQADLADLFDAKVDLVEVK